MAMRITRTMLLPTLLAMVQLAAYIFWPDRFDAEYGIEVKYQVVAAYIVFFASLMFSSVYVDTHTVNVEDTLINISPSIKKVLLFAVVAGTIIYWRVIVLSFVEIADIGLLGIRDRFFYDESYNVNLYGSKAILFLGNIIVMPMLVSILIFVMTNRTKFGNLLLWYLVILLALFSIASAGRFVFYYLVIIYVLVRLYSGRISGRNLAFIAVFFAVIVVISVTIQINRTADIQNYSATPIEDYIVDSLVNYHILGPYMLASGMVDNFGLSSGGNIPGLATIGSFVSPIVYLVTGRLVDVPSIYLGSYLSEMQVYSPSTFADYNAFGTFFASIFFDYKFGAIVASLIYGFCIPFLPSFVTQSLRKAFTILLAFLIYFGLFQDPLFSIGFEWIMIAIIFFSVISKKHQGTASTL